MSWLDEIKKIKDIAETLQVSIQTAHKFWESQLSKTNPRMYEIIKLRKDSQYVMMVSR